MARAMNSGTGIVAFFIEAVTRSLQSSSGSSGASSGSSSNSVSSRGVYGNGPGVAPLPLPPGSAMGAALGGKQLSARGFDRLSPMEKVGQQGEGGEMPPRLVLGTASGWGAVVGEGD